MKSNKNNSKKKKKKAQRNKNLHRVLLYVALLAIGGIIGLLIGNMNSVTISEEIDIMDVLALMATVFMAVYIPAVLDRRLQRSKETHDLLVNRVADYQTLQRRTNMLVQSTDTLSLNEKLAISNFIDVASNRLMTLTSLMTRADMGEEFDEMMRQIRHLDKERKELLEFPKSNGGDFSYSDEIKEKEQDLYNKLDEVTSLLIFSIEDLD